MHAKYNFLSILSPWLQPQKVWSVSVAFSCYWLLACGMEGQHERPQTRDSADFGVIFCDELFMRCSEGLCRGRHGNAVSMQLLQLLLATL